MTHSRIMLPVMVVAFFILLFSTMPGQAAGRAQSPDELTEVNLEELMGALKNRFCNHVVPG